MKTLSIIIISILTLVVTSCNQSILTDEVAKNTVGESRAVEKIGEYRDYDILKLDVGGSYPYLYILSKENKVVGLSYTSGGKVKTRVNISVIDSEQQAEIPVINENESLIKQYAQLRKAFSDNEDKQRIIAGKMREIEKKIMESK